MLLLAAIFVSVAAMPYVSGQFTCPIDDDRGTMNITIGDPDVCRVYYHCINGYPWPRQCPKDLHYSPYATANCTFSMCVQPAISGCVDSPFAEEKYQQLLPQLELADLELQEATEKEIEKKEEEDRKNDYYPCFRDANGNWVDTTLPSRLNCKQYYHCDRGVAWPSECPPTMYYTPKTGYLGPLGICEFQVCVDISEARCAIDGEWGEWGPWGECSAPCGNGLIQRRRECNNPPPLNGGDECIGRDIDLLPCNEGDCKENGTSVFVARLTDLSTGQTEMDPVEFESIILNPDDSFNPMDNTFTAQSDGLYFMALNAGALALAEVNIYLKGSGVPPVGCRRSSLGHVGRDAISSNIILPLNANDNINMAAGADTSISADAGKPTSWAIFNINDIGTTNSIFSYGYSSSENNPSNPLQFNVEVADLNGGYDSSTGLFRPIYPGIYFLCMGAGVDTSSQSAEVDFTMTCSGTCGNGFIQNKIRRSHDEYQGIDTLSRCSLAELQVGSQIMVTSAFPYYSSSSLETSFSGFFYQPDNAINRVAFYVARNGNWDDVVALDPVAFNRVVLEVGGGWGAEVTDYYTVPVSGYYVITISAGALPSKRVDLRLYQNDAYIFDVYRQSLAHEGNDIMSRIGIFFFSQGDRLRLRAVGNTGLWSTVTGYETSFGGMLLFPGEPSTKNREEAEKLMESLKV